MPGQATVSIRDKQWSVSVANTYAELATGLSGMPSMPAGTGMLFDLGYDSRTIQIDMTRMFFPLDIIFINSTQGVVGVMENIQPGMRDVLFENVEYPGARFFLEVNAGEALGIEVWDPVNIQGYTQPAQTIDINSLMSLMITVMIMVMMMRMMGTALEPAKERPKLPPGYKPVRHSSGGIGRHYGTCYEDAWRFLIKEEEGELVHGSVQTIGKRINHAWVELPTGYVWEPEGEEFIKKAYFYERAQPQVEARYTTEEAAVMAARTGNLGPWTEEERKTIIKHHSSSEIKESIKSGADVG